MSISIHCDNNVIENSFDHDNRAVKIWDSRAIALQIDVKTHCLQNQKDEYMRVLQLNSYLYCGTAVQYYRSPAKSWTSRHAGIFNQMTDNSSDSCTDSTVKRINHMQFECHSKPIGTNFPPTLSQGFSDKISKPSMHIYSCCFW